MSLPELPNDLFFEASITVDTVTVSINHGDYALVKRSVPCTSPGKWEGYITGLAETMFEDMSAAAKLGADLGILVIYE